MWCTVTFVAINELYSFITQSWSMNKLLHLKTSIKPILKAACKFIGSEDVNSTLVYLSLLEPSDITSLSDETQTPSLPPILGGLGEVKETRSHDLS